MNAGRSRPGARSGVVSRGSRPGAWWVWVAAGAGFAAAGCSDGPDLHCKEQCQCEQRGLCGQRRGACVPTEPQHCSGSQDCALFGRCTLRDHRCVIGSDADCKGSEQCARLGKCAARDGACATP